MPYQPDPPFPKEKGNPLRSKDWNQLVNEVQRLDSAKVNRTGKAILQGPLGIGLSNSAIPRAPLHISGGNWDLSNTEGDLRIGNDTHRLKIGMAWGGDGAGDVRIRAQGGTNRLLLGSGTSDVLAIQNGRVGIGITSNLTEKLTVKGNLKVDEGDLILQGGRYRRLKIVSDRYWAGIELVARGQGEAGNPHIDFTHGDLDSPNFGIRLFAPNNDRLVVTGGNLGVGTEQPAERLVVNGRAKSNNTRVQATASNSVSTSSNSWTNLPNMAISASTGSGPVLILFKVGGVQSTANNNVRARFRLLVDNVQRAFTLHEFHNKGWELRDVTLMWMGNLSSGRHNIRVQWHTSDSHAITVSWYGDTRNLILLEL